jgi:hypothetical protein
MMAFCFDYVEVILQLRKSLLHQAVGVCNMALQHFSNLDFFCRMDCQRKEQAQIIVIIHVPKDFRLALFLDKVQGWVAVCNQVEPGQLNGQLDIRSPFCQ